MVVQTKIPKKIDLSNRLFIVLAVFAVAFAVICLWQIIYQWKTFDQSNYNQINVSGEGKVSVSPDLATITLGLETNGKDVSEITKESTASMNKIIEELKALGLESADIQTTQYSVNPRYDYTDKGRVDDGYQIEQNIEVKIRDFDKIANVITIATENGANVINNLQFSIEDEQKAKNDAREKAIAQAKQKAQEIAQETGIKLGKIINFYESSSSSDNPIYYSVKSMSSAVALEDSAMGVSSNIESGEQEVTVTVNLVYKVK